MSDRLAQRYLLAQYVPERARMETRNIGVVLWANGIAEARFLTDSDAETVVNDIATYRRWVSYWHRLAYSDAIRLPREMPVTRSDPAFLDALLATQKGNYLLFDAGELVDPIAHGEAAAAINFLFDRLVRPTADADEATGPDTLKTLADQALENSGVAERPDFHASHQVQCKVFGVSQQLTFNYAIVPESTVAVFQRVPLRQQSVMSAATMFHSVVHSHSITDQARCGAIVDVTDEEREKPAVVRMLRTLRKVAKVVDLSDRAQAERTIKSIAA